jgi:hypothetical protein
MFLQRQLHDLDRTNDPSAKAAWLGKNDLHFA